MKNQTTILLLKPNNTRLLTKIISKLKKTNLKIKYWGKFQFTIELVKQFIPEKVNHELFNDITDYLCAGNSYVYLITGNDAIRKMTNIKGKTWSGQGIRGMYAKHPAQNILHCPTNFDELNLDLIFFSKIFNTGI